MDKETFIKAFNDEHVLALGDIKLQKDAYFELFAEFNVPVDEIRDTVHPDIVMLAFKGFVVMNVSVRHWTVIE